MSKISIVIPVYNGETFLEKCIESILNQTFSDFEVILVNDGSADNSAAISNNYAKLDSRVNVIHQENRGLSEARNVGIERALESESKWLTFIDCDDWISPHYLEYLYNESSGHEDSICVCNHVRTHEMHYNWDKEYTSTIYEPETFYVEQRVQATVAWGKLYPKDMFSEVRFPKGKIHEDEFVTYKLLFQEKNIIFINEPLYAYYQNPNGIMQKKWNLRKIDALQAYEEQLEFFKSNGFSRAYLESLKIYVRDLSKAMNQIKKKYPSYPEKAEIKSKLKHAYKLYKKHPDFMTKAYVWCMMLPIKSNEALKLVRKIRNAYMLYTEQGLSGIVRKLRKK